MFEIVPPFMVNRPPSFFASFAVATPPPMPLPAARFPVMVPPFIVNSALSCTKTPPPPALTVAVVAFAVLPEIVPSFMTNLAAVLSL